MQVNIVHIGARIDENFAIRWRERTIIFASAKELYTFIARDGFIKDGVSAKVGVQGWVELGLRSGTGEDVWGETKRRTFTAASAAGVI